MKRSYDKELKSLWIEAITSSEGEQSEISRRIDDLVTEVLALHGSDTETHQLKALAAVVYAGKPCGPEPTTLRERVNHIALVELGRIVWPDMPADI